MKLTEPSARLLAKLYFITQPPKYVFFRSEVGIHSVFFERDSLKMALECLLNFSRICLGLSLKVSLTVCPKVRDKSKVTLFSAKCGWIIKPFGLLIAPACGFDLVYEVS